MCIICIGISVDGGDLSGSFAFSLRMFVGFEIFQQEKHRTYAPHDQGDQIGRKFVRLAIVYFEQFL
jgi:hypothetical protein